MSCHLQQMKNKCNKCQTIFPQSITCDWVIKLDCENHINHINTSTCNDYNQPRKILLKASRKPQNTSKEVKEIRLNVNCYANY